MSTKRVNVVKFLAKTLAEWPPANVSPHTKPNNKLKKIINDKIRGRLANAVRDAESNIYRKWLARQTKPNVE